MSTATLAPELRDADAIAADVDRGLAVFAILRELETELKEIEARLKADALARPDEHEPLADAKREGRQFIAVGSAYTLPIIITADKLVGEFAAGSPVHQRIEAAAGGIMAHFFRPVSAFANRFKDGKAFRLQAAELMEGDAPAFIAACRAVDKDGIPKSDIKLQWEAAAAHTELEEAAAKS